MKTVIMVKRKIVFLSGLLTLVTFLIGASAVEARNYGLFVGGKITVRWVDYGDTRGERPDSINLVVGERLSSTMQHQTITLTRADAQVIDIPNDENFNSPVTEWKFDKGYYDKFFVHHGDMPDCLYEYSYIENLSGLGYNEVTSHITGDLHPTKFSLSGSVLEEPGTLVVTLIKDTLVTKKLTVKYEDSDFRDGGEMRRLDFAIRGQNVADPVAQNAYYRFRIEPVDTVKDDGVVDTYTKSFVISGTDAYQPGNPVIDYVFEEDSRNVDGRTVTYEINGDDILVTVTYRAKTRNVPIEVVWQDDEDKYGLRPSTLVLEAYDQEGNFEKDIVLSRDDDWRVNEVLYENMKYSGGTPIDYVIKSSENEDYEFTVSKEGQGYKVSAKLKGLEEVIEPSDDENPKEDKTENPKTGIFMTKYLVMLLTSLIGLVAVSKSRIVKSK